MQISFVLNGEQVTVDSDPGTTLLDYLRETRGLKGTKEGCNEGDCGACTVMITDAGGAKALNSCILFMGQLDGKVIRTVEGLSGHPVQEAMVRQHGSQCGFCTPGFVVSLAVAHANGFDNHNQVLAGNLCRCTGYAPIIRAAEAAKSAPVPAMMDERAAVTEKRGKTLAEFADWYAKNPSVTLIAGGTDVGLWATKQLRDLGEMAFLGAVSGLDTLKVGETEIEVGANVTIETLIGALAPLHPSFAAMLTRFGSLQVRNVATLGGNIANGSPIGDTPPPLIALGARLVLRKGKKRREIALEDFFLAYGKQDRQPGEFVESILIPRQADHLRVWKVSKRFDQDISALCGAFNIDIAEGRVRSARIAFGGMAGTPKRATNCEKALVGKEWSEEAVRAAMTALASDFVPMSDMRASATYRQQAAQNLLWRYWLDSQGQTTSVLEVTP